MLCAEKCFRSARSAAAKRDTSDRSREKKPCRLRVKPSLRALLLVTRRAQRSLSAKCVATNIKREQWLFQLPAKSVPFRSENRPRTGTTHHSLPLLTAVHPQTQSCSSLRRWPKSRCRRLLLLRRPQSNTRSARRPSPLRRTPRAFL